MKLLLLLLVAIFGTSTEPYFPEGAFEKQGRTPDATRQDWYSQQLKALQEPSAYASRDSSREIYRFLWLRTWDHPVAIRVEITEGTAKVIVKEADGLGGNKPGRLIRNSERTLSSDECSQFAKTFEEVAFWDEPTIESSNGRDGAQWVFEGVKQGKYHVVDRWSPPIRKNKFVKLGRAFIDLAQLGMPQKDIY